MLSCDCSHVLDAGKDGNYLGLELEELEHCTVSKALSE